MGRLATGIPELDAALGGGLPRGRLSELLASRSTGATSLALRACRAVTAERGGLVAWVDAPDALDPGSAAAAGLDLERLLWVRPPDLGAALAATEAVLAMGGFPLVVLDAGDPCLAAGRGLAGEAIAPGAGGGSGAGAVPGARRLRTRTPRRREGAAYGREPGSRARRGRADPFDARIWLRLARAAARARAVLLVLHACELRAADAAFAGGQGRPLAGTWAWLRIECARAATRWGLRDGWPPLLLGLETRCRVARLRGGVAGAALRLRSGA